MKKYLTMLHNEDLGYNVLRIVVGFLMLFHGVAKLMGGLGGVEGMLVSLGLPPQIAYGVLIGEVVAPVCVLLGLFVAPAALIMAFNMVVAVLLAHTGQLLSLSKTGGWALELQALYFAGAIAVALLAPVPTRLWWAAIKGQEPK